MRIVHLSDIHLSSSNIHEFRTSYKESLLSELSKQNESKKIDLIVISGDLVDKGGASLLQMEEFKDNYTNPYEIFEYEFIQPVINRLQIDKNNIIFVSGNHDINRVKINEIIDAGINSIVKSTEEANRVYRIISNSKDEKIDYLAKQRNYLDFERRYHSGNSHNYKISNFESYFTYSAYKKYKVGFGLINDSWMCSDKIKTESQFIGSNQLQNCLNYFESEKCNVIFLVIHHPLDSIDKEESRSIISLLYRSNYNIVILAGDNHTPDLKKIDNGDSSQSEILQIISRVAFNDPNEKESDYQPGYCLIELDEQDIIVHLKKFMKSTGRFEDDTEKGSAIRKFRDYIKIKIDDL